ncbi:MAG: 4-(cytidine 5'-diphospho)-2-C-methyl-D-erythritol kinase, partial [Bradyrhizobiaceae bacterium]|nr:4-(cytidine 5'-diphospho)-2-C-methyl-D-erythritol kinase [Bradyrhizobiaceae bacterium]
MAPPSLAEQALAKVNLTLQILGKRADGYHGIESLVVFARVGDVVTLRVGAELALSVRGPTATQTGAIADNLVLKAARALAAVAPGLTLGRFDLTKELPAGAGLGGGSADAAAALRLLARANGIGLNEPRVLDAAHKTGADVPVCLDPRPRVMRGIGEILSEPLDLPKLPAVILYPGVSMGTKGVFEALGLSPGEWRESRSLPALTSIKREALIALLDRHGNDLEPAAVAMAPVIAEVVAALRALPGCQ